VRGVASPSSLQPVKSANSIFEAIGIKGICAEINAETANELHTIGPTGCTDASVCIVVYNSQSPRLVDSVIVPSFLNPASMPHDQTCGWPSNLDYSLEISNFSHPRVGLLCCKFVVH
jgi:hypothetical protein